MSGIDDAIDWDHPPSGLDTITADLRSFRAAAGYVSFAEIARRIAAQRARRGAPEHEQRVPRGTVYYCFQDGRSRVDVDMLVEVAAALGVTRTRMWAARVRNARAASDTARIATAFDELPAPVPYFTGRDQEQKELTRRMMPDDDALIWVTGMAGIGKSQLALRWAGQNGAAIFLDLRGHRTGTPPVEPAAAQYALLRILGYDTRGLVDEDDRTHALRRALAATPRTIVLDDARDQRQVAEIIGGTPVGRVLVTSRTVPEGWDVLRLGGLDAQQTERLLHTLTATAHGPVVTRDDAARLATVSDGLPLLVTLVGGQLATKAGWTLADHVDLLQQRIQEGRLSTALQAELGLSYAGLGEHSARLLRALADLPLTQVDAEVAAVVLDSTTTEAQAALDGLVQRSLAAAQGDGGTTLHALVRAFARERAEETDPPSTRAATFVRVAQHYAGLVWAAYQRVATSVGETPRPTQFPYPHPHWSRAEATRWLERNRADILALAHQAPSRGQHEWLFCISEGMSWWMSVSGYHREALDLHEAAAEHAAALRDTDALVKASLDAGQLLYHGNDPERAAFQLGRAQRLLHDVDGLTDPGLAGVLWNMTALVHLRRGELTEARELLERAVRLHESRDEDGRLLAALTNLAMVLRNAGFYGAARAVLDRGLAVADQICNTLSEAFLLLNRAQLRIEADPEDLSTAEQDALRGRLLAEELASRYLEISASCTLAHIRRLRGEVPEARTMIDAAVQMARKLGAELPLAEALLAAATIAKAGGDSRGATAFLDEAEGLLSAGSDLMWKAQMWQLRADLTEDPRVAAELHAQAVQAFRRAGAEHRVLTRMA